MKRCPTCSKTYTDPNLSFCVDDGTPLVEVESDAPPYEPPGSYMPPGTVVPKRRSAWPWILGILGAFILGIVGLMIAAAIIVPRIAKQQRPTVSVNTNTNTNTNTNQADETPATDNINTPPPTDEQQVLAQLTDIENEWTVANLNADKKKLARILADDYVGPSGEDGALQGKAEYINTIQRDTTVEKWEFEDLKLLLAGDRATLTGKITYVQQGQEIVFDFTDRFVWRDGRWQATGSEIKRRE
jgi:cytoskeletal protein RodZ